MSAGDPSPAAVLSVELGPLHLQNPILTASGTFGCGMEFAPFQDLNLLGGMVLKSVTREPRTGNPGPRIMETPSGLLNSIGLENPGVDVFVQEILPRLEGLRTKVIVSVAGRQDEDFTAVAKAVSSHPRVDAIELNVSCPNQKEGGMAYGTDPKATEALTRRVRNATDLPLMVKLTPNVTDIKAAARAAARGGADILCLVNTFLGLSVDWRTRKPSIAGIRGRGGLSGPAIKPLALRCVADVFEAVDLPVVGMGGILTADDVLEFASAGARAVQVGTANFLDPSLAARLPREVGEALDREGIPSYSALVGSLDAG